MRDPSAILRARAASLAQTPQADDPGSQVELVEFRLGGETYAVEGTFVREVVRVAAVTPLPCTPTFVAGILSLRGRIVTVLDTNVLLGLRGEPSADSGPVIMVGAGRASTGLRVDALLGTRRILRAELEAASGDVSGGRSARLSAITVTGAGVLDVEGLFADPALVVDGS